MENEMQFVLVFHLNEEIKKRITETVEQVEITFMIVVASMVYRLFKSKLVSSPLRFSAFQWSSGHQNPLFTFIIVIVNCNIIHLSRCSHHEVLS